MAGQYREAMMKRASHWVWLLIASSACSTATQQEVQMGDYSPGIAATMAALSEEQLALLAEANMKQMLDAPGSASFKPFNGRIVMLAEELTYKIGNSGLTITVPRGFVTDFASIPRVFWVLLPPMGKYTRAAVVHDWLYWTQVCSRDQSDNLLLMAMVESEVSAAVRTFIEKPVRMFGGWAWDGNATEKRQGYVHMVVPPLDAFPPNTEWEKYREMLRAQHAADVPKPTDLRFCQLGNGSTTF